MSDDSTVPGRVVVVEQSEEVVYVERERPAQGTHETTIIRDDDRGGISQSMLLILVLGFLLIVGLIYTVATSGDDKSEKDGLNLSIDVVAPQIPTFTVPAVDVEVKAPDVDLPHIESQKSQEPVAPIDTSIAPGEPLVPVEPAKTE